MKIVLQYKLFTNAHCIYLQRLAALLEGFSFSGPAFLCLLSFLVPHFQVLHFQSTRIKLNSCRVEFRHLCVSISYTCAADSNDCSRLKIDQRTVTL